MMPRMKKRKQPKGIVVSGNEARGLGVRSRIGLDFDKLREAGWTISERQPSPGDKILFRYVNPIGKTLKSSKDVEKQLREEGTYESFVLETNESPGYVVCFVCVYIISCCLHCHVLVILCLCTYYIIFFLPLFTTKSNTLPHHKKG